MARTTGADRAKRLIALLAHLRRQGDIDLSSLAEDTGLTVPELTDDLVTLSCCGIAPYDPFALVPVMVLDDQAQVFGELPAMRGPVRLSAGEATALAAALQAAGFAADDPLTSKLMSALGESFSAENLAKIVMTGIEGHGTDVYRLLAVAIERSEAVEIVHRGAEGAGPIERVIEPEALFAERGVWYVSAWCRLADARRNFRLDRISEVTATGRAFEAGRHGAPVLEALEADDLPRARLRFSADCAFDEREWPGASVVEVTPEGETVAEVPFAGTGWLPRRVAARSGEVELLSPPELRKRVAEVAREALRDLSG